MTNRKFSSIARQAVRGVLAKGRPSTLFEQAFYDIREKAKDWKSAQEQELKGKLLNAMVKDLKSRKVNVLDAKISLGRYRGSSFVTSFKLKVKVSGGQKEAEQIANYLRGKYSPKWKVKKVSDDGVADFNVR